MEPQTPTVPAVPTPPPQPQPAAAPVPVQLPRKSNLVVVLLFVLLVVSVSISVLLALQVQTLTKQLAQYQSATPSPTPSPTPTQPVVGKEPGCINSGGSVSTAMCCKSVDDFPNTCLIGACGCSPENSHQVKICNCEIDRCFNGSECIGQ